MALWGNNDAVGSGGTVSLDYDTKIVTGTATTFGNIGAAKTGDVIRFGDRDGTYMGDAIIVGIASTTQLTIGSTMGLSGAGIAGTSFTVSELPKSSVKDVKYSEGPWGTEDSFTTTSVYTSQPSTVPDVTIYAKSGTGSYVAGDIIYTHTFTWNTYNSDNLSIT